MSDKEFASALLKYLGGPSNIDRAYNCYTRVRVVVKNVDIVEGEEIKKLPGIIVFVIDGMQVQVCVGTGKSAKYAQALNELMQQTPSASNKKSEDINLKPASEKEYLENKKKVRNRKTKSSVLFKKIAGIFVPLIPAFIACGLIMAIVEMIKMGNPAFADSQIGKVFNIICTSVFGILHIVVGYNACKEFGGSGVIGACLAAILYAPELTDIVIGIDFQPGLGGVVSVILIAVGSAYFERLVRKFMPNILDAIVTPLIVILVMSFVGLFAIQPLGGYISKGITMAVEGICNNAPYLLGIVPLFYLFMVMFGVHHVLMPINIELITKSGFSMLVPMQLVAGAAEVGAAIFFALTTRNKKMKKTVIESIPIGILGIDEPLIWGMSFPLKRLFIPSSLGGAIAGAISAAWGIASPIPETIGIEGAAVFNKKWEFAVVFIAAIVFGFIFASIIGYKETYEVVNPDGSVTEETHETSLLVKKWIPRLVKTKFYAGVKKGCSVIASPFKKLLIKMHIIKPKAKTDDIKIDNNNNIIVSPFNGKVIPIESLKDKTFAGKVMGDGLAIIPSEGKFYAPISGTITALFDTKHAYGLTSDTGFELLVHIGQDTVNLNGEGFTANFKQGDKVNKGDLLGTFDIPFIEQRGYSVATPIILIAGGEYKIVSKAPEGDVKVGDQLITISK